MTIDADARRCCTTGARSRGNLLQMVGGLLLVLALLLPAMCVRMVGIFSSATL